MKFSGFRGLGRALALAGLALLGPATAASAHFGMVIPSAAAVEELSAADLTVDVKFWHPFANSGMDMEKPAKFQVFTGGKALDILPALRERKLGKFKTWSAAYKIERPGLYVFALEPKPYWEPEEDKFIIHYAKAYVEAFGDDEGWDEPLGLKTEIVPLTRPSALYAGGLFSGRALVDGKPAPHIRVEAEWYPGEDKQGQAPHADMLTLSLKADDNGVFHFAAPKSGWWGFAALSEADYRLKREGQEKDVELGGVVWVYFHDMPEARPAPAGD